MNMTRKERMPSDPAAPRRGGGAGRKADEKRADRRGKNADRVIVVIDDDPTGIQTVHGVDVYMNWEAGALADGFRTQSLFFILSNTRAFDRETADRINREIMHGLLAASERARRDFAVVSRGDSTLRGHFFRETEVLRETYERHTGRKFDGEIIVPFFAEGGRYTIDDIHYVSGGSELIPAGQTEYARDSVFGYESSDLKDFIEEKTKGAVRKESVASITLAMLREKKLDDILEILMSARNFSKIIVNCTGYDELDVFVAGLREAESRGRRFMCRTAASFVKAYARIKDRELLTRADLPGPSPGQAGRTVVVVGSHVERTRGQLLRLLRCGGVCPVELDVARILENEETRSEEIAEKTRTADRSLRGGGNPVVYTSSVLRGAIHSRSADREDELGISSLISDSLAKVVTDLEERPDFVVAKGGITSRDVAVKSLRMKKARVLGQILPGIPVILPGRESKWPGAPYVIFPGNVGNEDALKTVCEVLSDAGESARADRL